MFTYQKCMFFFVGAQFLRITAAEPACMVGPEEFQCAEYFMGEDRNDFLPIQEFGENEIWQEDNGAHYVQVKKQHYKDNVQKSRFKNSSPYNRTIPKTTVGDLKADFLSKKNPDFIKKTEDSSLRPYTGVKGDALYERLRVHFIECLRLSFSSTLPHSTCRSLEETLRLVHLQELRQSLLSVKAEFITDDSLKRLCQNFFENESLKNVSTILSYEKYKFNNACPTELNHICTAVVQKTFSKAK